MNYDHSTKETTVVTGRKIRQFFLDRDEDIVDLDNLLMDQTKVIDIMEHTFSQNSNTYVVFIKWIETKKEKISPFSREG